MKLTAMTAEELRVALCDLSGPLCAILTDSRLTPIITRITAPDLPLPAAAAVLMGELLPLILRDHDEDFFAALSILTGEDTASLRAMPGPGLIQLIRQVWDEELTAFFASAGIVPGEKFCAQ